jgi:diguanylate cyclase (GGDEF)-like protein
MEHRLVSARASVVYEDGRGIVRHAGDPAFAGVLRSHWRRRPEQRAVARIPMAESVGFAEIWEVPFGATDEEPAVGALYVLSPVADALRLAPAGLLERSAHLAGLAVRRWHARAALVQVASRDPLTGLHNRGALGELLQRLRTQPTTTPDRPVTGVLYCDLDGFDVVNDAFGHRGGDRVLRVAAERIVREARTADLCARVGDDQFVIVCSRLRDNRFAQALAHRLVRRFAQPIAVEEGEAVIVPMRIGVATTAFPAQIPELVAAADRALHRAKDKGEATELDVVGPPRRAADREGA